MKCLVSFLFMAMNLISCSHNSSTADQVYAFMGQYSDEVEEKYGWKLMGLGGWFDDKINKISLDYYNYQKATLAQAREILLSGINELLVKANNCEILKDRIKSNRLTYKELKYGIAFLQPSGKFVTEEYIASAYLQDEIIYYSIYKDDRLIHIHEEPYEDSLKIVDSPSEQH